MNGIDPFSLARLLGHEDLNTTKHYVQIYGNDLKKQSKKEEHSINIYSRKHQYVNSYVILKELLRSQIHNLKKSRIKYLNYTYVNNP